MSPVVLPNVCHPHMARAYLALCPVSSRLPSVPAYLFEDSGDGADCQFNEAFLQALWNEQYLVPALRTVSGSPVEVVARGTWNVEPGPDFLNAVVRIDGNLRQGAIEVHRTSRDWWQHGHGEDPAYRSVVLHVVWRHKSDARDHLLPPCLELRGAVQRPWQALSADLGPGNYPYARKVPAGPCCRALAELSDESLSRLLSIAGIVRFRERAAHLQQKIISDGPGQALYSAVFDALGYKANRQPFGQLAAALPLAFLRSLPSATVRQAALFGVAGMLPDPTQQALPPATHELAHRLWDAWWPLGRPAAPLHWARTRCRPLNTPERRLAAGCELLERWRCEPDRVVWQVAMAAEEAKGLLRGLTAELEVGGEWGALTTFKRRLRRPARLLGQARARDIVSNVLLPYLSARAGLLGVERVSALAEDACLGAPKLQSNRLLAEASHRLFVPPSRARDVLRGACHQQGLLSLYRDFCSTRQEGCRGCPLTCPGAFEKLALAG